MRDLGLCGETGAVVGNQSLKVVSTAMVHSRDGSERDARVAMRPPEHCCVSVGGDKPEPGGRGGGLTRNSLRDQSECLVTDLGAWQQQGQNPHKHDGFVCLTLKVRR